MNYQENSLTYEEYCSLRESVGWKNFPKIQIQEILRVSGTIEQHFCASEGYYITRPVAALCKPYQFRFFARLNIHAGIANCYAGRSRFYWRAYKPLTVLLLSPKSIAALRVITLHCVTHNNILRAQAVYPFAPS